MLVQVALQPRLGWASGRRMSQVPQSVQAMQARSMGVLQRGRGPGIRDGGRQLGSSQPLTSGLAESIQLNQLATQ